MTRRRAIYAVSALLLTLVGACRQAPIGDLTADVVNVSTEIAPEPCDGGLKAIVVVSGVELFNATVPVDKEATRSIGELSPEFRSLYQGTPVVTEVWCLDERGAEEGFTRTTGTLNLYYRSDSINIYPYAPDASLCSPGTRRGRFPCVIDGDLVR